MNGGGGGRGRDGADLAAVGAMALPRGWNPRRRVRGALKGTGRTTDASLCIQCITLGCIYLIDDFIGIYIPCRDVQFTESTAARRVSETRGPHSNQPPPPRSPPLLCTSTVAGGHPLGPALPLRDSRAAALGRGRPLRTAG